MIKYGLFNVRFLRYFVIDSIVDLEPPIGSEREKQIKRLKQEYFPWYIRPLISIDYVRVLNDSDPQDRFLLSLVGLR